MKMMHPRKHKYSAQYRPQQWVIRPANRNLRQLVKMADLTIYLNRLKIIKIIMKHLKDCQDRVRAADRKLTII